jgi:cobalt-zinc-cadmium efflux system membrane fusion protein
MKWLYSAMFVALVACGNSKKASDAEKKPEGAEATEAAEGPDLIRLTKEQAETAKVTTAPAQRRSETAAIGATGEIEPPEDGIARIGPKVAGRVVRLLKGVGDPVKRGELIAMIDSPDLGRAKADYIASAAIAQVTKEAATREGALYEKKISSEKDWRQAEADATKARAEKDAAEVRLHTLGISDAQLDKLDPREHLAASFAVASPIDGVVVERSVTLGQLAQPQETMFVVMDLRNVWVLADVYERDLGQVATGQKVIARVPAWKDRTFEGTVALVGSVIERKSRAVKIRVVLPNPDGALKPGMFATVEIAGTSGAAHTGVYVPSSAVQREANHSLVFVVKEPGVYEPRRVEVGQVSRDWVEIQRGLSEGEQVAISGGFALKSEMKKDELGEDD